MRETVWAVDVIFEESGVAKSLQHAIVERATWEVFRAQREPWSVRVRSTAAWDLCN